MRHRPEFEHRITFRVPKALADALNKECADADTNVSAVVRQSLVEHLSPKATEPRR